MAQKNKQQVHAINIAKNVIESASHIESPEKATKRGEVLARRAHRRATSRKPQLKTTTPKTYDILVQYHQLNYGAIKEAVEANKFVCKAIDNTRLWLINADQATMEQAKEAFIACHFVTKAGKEYKIRFAAYTHIEHPIAHENKKAPTNNKPEVAKAAKAVRKATKLARFKARPKHSKNYKANHVIHMPGSKQCSSFEIKLKERIKKATKQIVRTEKDRATQAKSRASKANSKHVFKNGKQQTLKFAA